VTMCCECDALPGACGHSTFRYLPDVVYERADGAGWRVPATEMHRWENPPLVVRRSAPTGSASLGELEVQLRPLVEWSPGLEHRLGVAYEADGSRVTRIVAAVVQAAATGRANNPAGMLWKMLGEVRR